MRRFESAANMAQPAESQKQTPSRPADWIADLGVPMAQAGVTGLLLATICVYILSLTRYTGDLGRLWVGLVLGVTSAAWLLLLVDTRKLLWALERVTGLDVDQDGHEGPPPTIRVEVTEGARQVYLDLPGEPEDLATMARGVLNGRSLAEGTWSGRGGLFSRSEFRTIRDELIERGLATWRNPRAKAQGVELTAAGRAVFRLLAELQGEKSDA
jgi:hypothetical protein